jgi:hypothetical protein
MRATQNLLELAGIGKDRLHVAWVSSAEAQRFVEVVKSVTESVKAQGHFDPEAFSLQLDAAERTLNTEIVRWLIGKEKKLTKQGDVYGRVWDSTQLQCVLDTVLEREYKKHLIYQAIKEGHTSVRDVSKRTGLELRMISYLLTDMEKTNMVEFKGMHDRIPEFAAI